jgi:hypothetical protein
MRRFSTFGCRGTGVLLVLFLATSTTGAASNAAPATAQMTGGEARSVSGVSSENPYTRAGSVSDGADRRLRFRLVSDSAHGQLAGAILGDRQRMVQVALIFMGVAILILTRGNRF